MHIRDGPPRWEGGLEEGSGTVDTPSGALSSKALACPEISLEATLAN